MHRSETRLLIITLFYFSTAENGCDPNDLYLTRQSNSFLEKLKLGLPGLELIYPLHEDKISGETPELDYVLDNVTLIGMTDSHVELLSINSKDLTFKFISKSPRFVITFNYKVSGTLDSRSIDHEGSCKTIFDNYTITLKGQNTQTIDTNDNKTRMFMEYFHVDNETFDKVIVHSGTVRDQDKHKVDAVMSYLEIPYGEA